MKVHGIKDVKGASSIVGDVKSSSDGSSIEIDGIEWGVGRNINMDVGNGNNSDTGALEAENVVITKKVDGISPSLMTILFKPTKGRVVDFIFSVPNKDGKGYRTQFIFTIDDAKLVDYTVTTETSEEDGSVPMEQVTFSYGSIVSKYFPTNISGIVGELTPDMVVYNVETGELEAGVEVK